MGPKTKIYYDSFVAISWVLMDRVWLKPLKLASSKQFKIYIFFNLNQGEKAR